MILTNGYLRELGNSNLYDTQISLGSFSCLTRSFSRFSSYIKKVIDDNNQAEGTAMLLKVSRTILEIEVTDFVFLALLLGEL